MTFPPVSGDMKDFPYLKGRVADGEGSSAKPMPPVIALPLDQVSVLARRPGRQRVAATIYASYYYSWMSTNNRPPGAPLFKSATASYVLLIPGMTSLRSGTLGADLRSGAQFLAQAYSMPTISYHTTPTTANVTRHHKPQAPNGDTFLPLNPLGC